MHTLMMRLRNCAFIRTKREDPYTNYKSIVTDCSGYLRVTSSADATIATRLVSTFLPLFHLRLSLSLLQFMFPNASPRGVTAVAEIRGPLVCSFGSVLS